MEPKIPIHWTSHLPGKEKKAFRESVLASRFILERLAQILEQKAEADYRQTTDPSQFSKPDFTHRVAHANGYNRALQDVIDLITFREVNHDR